MKTLIATLMITAFTITGLMTSDSAEANPFADGGYDVYDNTYQLQSQIRSAPSFGYDW